MLHQVKEYLRASAALQTIRHNFISTCGPILFNCLPKELRSMTDCSALKFKNNLDKFLVDLPDESDIPGQTSLCPTNRIKDQVSWNRQLGYQQADIPMFT